ncbi:enoyl-ACP reductase FabI [Pleionea mediterranea]|uniref:Enoyl-[acyl-carrier-protein] reductase [NADH] n=1 Tax=Pleionea mediterranea TaxID=523701 RepID=A0A316FIA0_9GAMM|nr:SDR family oxidoreductase [Pleionea mediterranea]PWK47822.1 enoyl-[acyl-carrier-protein] reductase [NADH] [Pleionea mediterranea]
MSDLSGKTALITGVSTADSLAWGIVEKFHTEGCQIILSYQGASHLRRIKKLCREYNITPDAIYACDFGNEQQVKQLFEDIAAQNISLDIFIHSMAYADAKTMQGAFSDCTKHDFAQCMEISVFSLINACHYLKPLMPNGGSIQTLTYNGAQKVLPNYHIMGVAKAALESSVRYLASELGPDKIRVNAISAGPIETVAAASIPSFQQKMQSTEGRIPTRKNTTKEDVAAMSSFLASNHSQNITGSIYYVDGGLHTLGW